MGVFEKIDTFKRFRTTSKRESQEVIKRDRGALSRIVTWFAELGALSGLTSLSNNVSTFAWGQALGYVSNAGFIFLGADAVASVEEIARNKAIYSKKKNATTRFIQALESEKGLDIKTEDGLNAIQIYSRTASKSISFRDRHGIILKQLFVDFEDKKEYDKVRELIKAEYNLSDESIIQIKDDANKFGYVQKSTVKQITSKHEKLENILDSIACQDFASRIHGIRKNEVSRFNSGSHLKGALALTPEQQTKSSTKFALTEEQEHIRKTAKYSKEEMREILTHSSELIENGDLEELEKLQKDVLDDMLHESANSGKLKEDLLFELDSFKDIKKVVDKTAKKTAEHTIANWSRHVLPLTKKLGSFAKLLINLPQDKLRYRGELKAHKGIKRFEKESKLRVADVYTENGVGYRKLRKKFIDGGCKDILKEQPDMPKNLACGHSRVKGYLDSTNNFLFHSIYEICEKAQKLVVNDKQYRATRYLDDPIVIKVYGNGFAYKGKTVDPTMPIAVYNADHIETAKGIIEGLVYSIGMDDKKTIYQRINSIEITSGNRTRTIYPPQIIKDVETYEKDSLKTDELFLTKAVKAVAVEEDFVRIIGLDDSKIESWCTSYKEDFDRSVERSEEKDKVNEKIIEGIEQPTSALTREEIAKSLTKMENEIVGIVDDGIFKLDDELRKKINENDAFSKKLENLIPEDDSAYEKIDDLTDELNAVKGEIEEPVVVEPIVENNDDKVLKETDVEENVEIEEPVVEPIVESNAGEIVVENVGKEDKKEEVFTDFILKGFAEYRGKRQGSDYENLSHIESLINLSIYEICKNSSPYYVEVNSTMYLKKPISFKFTTTMENGLKNRHEYVVKHEDCAKAVIQGLLFGIKNKSREGFRDVADLSYDDVLISDGEREIKINSEKIYNDYLAFENGKDFEELEIYKAMEDLLEENSYRSYILIPEKDYEGKIDNLIDMYKDAYDECLIEYAWILDKKVNKVDKESAVGIVADDIEEVDETPNADDIDAGIDNLESALNAVKGEIEEEVETFEPIVENNAGEIVEETDVEEAENEEPVVITPHFEEDVEEKSIRYSKDEIAKIMTKIEEDKKNTTTSKTKKTVETKKSTIFEEIKRLIGTGELSDGEKAKLIKILNTASKTKKGSIKKTDSKVKRTPTVEVLKERLEELKKQKKEKLDKFVKDNKKSKIEQVKARRVKIEKSISRVEKRIEEFEKFLEDAKEIAPTVEDIKKQLRKIAGVKGGITRNHNKVVLEQTSVDGDKTRKGSDAIKVEEVSEEISEEGKTEVIEETHVETTEELSSDEIARLIKKRKGPSID